MRLQRYLNEKYFYTAFDEDIYQNPDIKELIKIREDAWTGELKPFVAAILYGNGAIVFSDNILHQALIPKLQLNKDKVITIRLEFVDKRTVHITTSDTMQYSKTYGKMDAQEMEDVVLNHPWIKKLNVKSFIDKRNR